jgi:uncharacterized membrane protein YqaE (UPF0057 family)
MILIKENKYTARIKKLKNRKNKKNSSAASGQGPIGKILIFLFKDLIFNTVIITIYNFFIDLFSMVFEFVDSMFFGEFKGILGGKLKSKKGSCFEYTYFRYFMTLMIPPAGIFLARGVCAWYNIIICSVLCILNYFPGLIYAFIVMHNAPYATKYQKMKRDKLERVKPTKPQGDVEKALTPLVFFLIIVMITGLFILNNLHGTKPSDIITSTNNVVKQYGDNFSVGSYVGKFFDKIQKLERFVKA